MKKILLGILLTTVSCGIGETADICQCKKVKYESFSGAEFREVSKTDWTEDCDERVLAERTTVYNENVGSILVERWVVECK